MMIKKFISIVLATCSIMLATHAIGPCVMYWVPNMQFFNAGGSVYVSEANGGSYSVTKADVVPGDQYSLANGDLMTIFMPSCGLWSWGSSVFCTCNETGGLDCGTPMQQGQGGMLYYQLRCDISCGCPTGSSSGGLHWVFGKYCQAPPPP